MVFRQNRNARILKKNNGVCKWQVYTSYGWQKRYTYRKRVRERRYEIVYCVWHMWLKQGIKQYFIRQFYRLCKFNRTLWSSWSSYFHIQNIWHSNKTSLNYCAIVIWTQRCMCSDLNMDRLFICVQGASTRTSIRVRV